MNYVVLEAPDFSLQAWQRLHPETLRQPVAIVQGQGRQAVVVQVNSAALSAGIRAGLSRAQALGICPALAARTPNAFAEEDAGALLLNAAWTLSPQVEQTEAGVFTVDASARRAADLRRDIAAVIPRLDAQGLTVRIGLGPSPLVARFAAHRADPVFSVGDSREFLTPLPVDLLGLTENEAELFDGLGLRTLGDLARLPQSAFISRLGQRGAELWLQAGGQDWRPLRLAVRAQRFLVSYDLEHPIETLEPLLFLLRRFSERLAGELESALMVAGSLCLTLCTEGDEPITRDFRLPEPTVKPDALFKVLENHLAELRTQHAVNGLRLEIFPVRPTVRQDGLFETTLRDPHRFYDTIARATAVLGNNRVGTPRHDNTHRPDAFSLIPPPAVIPDYTPPAMPPARGPLLRRFRPPCAARVGLRDGVPATVDCDRFDGTVREASGPWRRSGDWWDADAWAREEWDVELATRGIYRLVRTAEGWMLEGVYE